MCPLTAQHVQCLLYLIACALDILVTCGTYKKVSRRPILTDVLEPEQTHFIWIGLCMAQKLVWVMGIMYRTTVGIIEQMLFRQTTMCTAACVLPCWRLCMWIDVGTPTQALTLSTVCNSGS